MLHDPTSKSGRARSFQSHATAALEETSPHHVIGLRPMAARAAFMRGAGAIARHVRSGGVPTTTPSRLGLGSRQLHTKASCQAPRTIVGAGAGAAAGGAASMAPAGSWMLHAAKLGVVATAGLAAGSGLSDELNKARPAPPNLPLRVAGSGAGASLPRAAKPSVAKQAPNPRAPATLAIPGAPAPAPLPHRVLQASPPEDPNPRCTSPLPAMVMAATATPVSADANLRPSPDDHVSPPLGRGEDRPLNAATPPSSRRHYHARHAVPTVASERSTSGTSQPQARHEEAEFEGATLLHRRSRSLSSFASTASAHSSHSCFTAPVRRSYSGTSVALMAMRNERKTVVALSPGAQRLAASEGKQIVVERESTWARWLNRQYSAPQTRPAEHSLWVDDSPGVIRPEQVSLFMEYTVLPKQLGEGAYATVSLCRHKATKEIAAVKTVNCSDEESRNGVLDEARIMARLSHARILKLHACFYTRSCVHMVTDAGHIDLFDCISAVGHGASESQVRRIAYQLLTAVRHMHAQGVMHRDIKPENVLVFSPRVAAGKLPPTAALSDPDFHVKLADFGLAKACTCDYKPSARERQPTHHETCLQGQESCGTPYFCPPEVILAPTSGVSYDKSCDIWSLGATLFTVAGGYLPYKFCEVNDSRTWEQRVLDARLLFHNKFWHDKSHGLRDLITRMLDPNHATRPTVDECLKHPWLGGRTIDLPVHALRTALPPADPMAGIAGEHVVFDAILSEVDPVQLLTALQGDQLAAWTMSQCPVAERYSAESEVVRVGVTKVQQAVASTLMLLARMKHDSGTALWHLSHVVDMALPARPGKPKRPQWRSAVAASMRAARHAATTFHKRIEKTLGLWEEAARVMWLPSIDEHCERRSARHSVAVGTWERVPIDALATLLKDFVLGNVELSLPRGSNPQMTNAALGCAEADTLSADLQLQTRCVTMALSQVLELLKADTRGVVTILRRLENIVACGVQQLDVLTDSVLALCNPDEAWRAAAEDGDHGMAHVQQIVDALGCWRSLNFLGAVCMYADQVFPRHRLFPRNHRGEAFDVTAWDRE